MVWYQWVFSGIGVAAIVGGVAYAKRLRAEGVMLGCKLLDRDHVDRAVGTVEQRIRNANQSIWFSGMDCKLVAEACSAAIEAALKRSVRVKVLCVDPQSQAVTMLPKIDPRFPTADSFRSSMKLVVERLSDFARRYPSLFEYRLLPILPAQGFFITDPTDKKGIVKVEIYTAKEYAPLGSRPHLVFSSRANPWRRYFINQWENYWELATAQESRGSGPSADAEGPSTSRNKPPEDIPG